MTGAQCRCQGKAARHHFHCLEGDKASLEVLSSMVVEERSWRPDRMAAAKAIDAAAVERSKLTNEHC